MSHTEACACSCKKTGKYGSIAPNPTNHEAGRAYDPKLKPLCSLGTGAGWTRILKGFAPFKSVFTCHRSALWELCLHSLFWESAGARSRSRYHAASD
jgi:hypothetical protein